MIPEDFIVSFVEKIKPTSESIKPSFFELTVAMMLYYFAEEKVDIAIVETGLGGRLDSTNIITPELSIITNIGWDHMNILGNSLKEIAEEKEAFEEQGQAVHHVLMAEGILRLIRMKVEATQENHAYACGGGISQAALALGREPQVGQ